MTSSRLAREWNCITRVGTPLTRMFCAIHCTLALGGIGISGHGSTAHTRPGPDSTARIAATARSSKTRVARLSTAVTWRAPRGFEGSLVVEFMAARSSVAKVIGGVRAGRIVQRIVGSAGCSDPRLLVGHDL